MHLAKCGGGGGGAFMLDSGAYDPGRGSNAALRVIIAHAVRSGSKAHGSRAQGLHVDYANRATHWQVSQIITWR